MDQAHASAPLVAPVAQGPAATPAMSRDPRMRAQGQGGGGNSLAQLRLQGLACEGTGTPWDGFAADFNEHFAHILHVFAESSDSSGVPAERLQALFSERQRCKLVAFMATNRIPDRLFTAEDLGRASAQQRILLSAEILANGEYEPGSFSQRVHARMCGHWVQLVNNYAGVTPSSGPLSEGIMGEFDHSGNLVMGGGSADRDAAFHGARVSDENLPDVESPDAAGPLLEGSEQAERAAAAEVAGRESRFFRQLGMPFEELLLTEPGDWLYFYNANGSPSGGHSVIFSHWSGEEVAMPGGVRYRRATCFSQGQPERGGREHTALLGNAAFRAPEGQVTPVTHRSRVTEGAHPATTPEEFLPASRREAALEAENQRFLAGLARRLGRQVDLVRLEAWLHDANAPLIEALRGCTTEQQRALLRETNGRSDIEMLVRLHQRLTAFVADASRLEANEQAQYQGPDGLNARHAAASVEASAQEAALDEQRAVIAAERRPLAESLAQVTAELGAYETREARRAHAADIQRLRARKRELERQIRPLERREARLVAQRRGVEASLPFGLAHPGNLGDRQSGRTSGRLAALSGVPYERLLVEAPIAAD
jgi:hypothetical protein